MGEMNKNIILIGMPGSEKTTIGKTLSKRLGFKFIDINQRMESESMPFKAKLPDTKKMECSIISTGVETLKDHLSIKENGVVIFIDKPVEKIIEDKQVLNNRSLLKDEVNKIKENFYEKYETYKNCCDVHMINNNNVDEIIYYICSIWG